MAYLLVFILCYTIIMYQIYNTSAGLTLNFQQVVGIVVCSLYDISKTQQECMKSTQNANLSFMLLEFPENIIFNFCNKLSSKSQRRARPAFNSLCSYYYLYLLSNIQALLFSHRLKETIALLAHTKIRQCYYQ